MKCRVVALPHAADNRREDEKVTLSLLSCGSITLRPITYAYAWYHQASVVLQGQQVVTLRQHQKPRRFGINRTLAASLPAQQQILRCTDSKAAYVFSTFSIIHGICAPGCSTSSTEHSCFTIQKGVIFGPLSEGISCS